MKNAIASNRCKVNYTFVSQINFESIVILFRVGPNINLREAMTLSASRLGLDFIRVRLAIESWSNCRFDVFIYELVRFFNVYDDLVCLLSYLSDGIPINCIELRVQIGDWLEKISRYIFFLDRPQNRILRFT